MIIRIDFGNCLIGSNCPGQGFVLKENKTTFLCEFFEWCGWIDSVVNFEKFLIQSAPLKICNQSLADIEQSHRVFPLTDLLLGCLSFRVSSSLMSGQWLLVGTEHIRWREQLSESCELHYSQVFDVELIILCRMSILKSNWNLQPLLNSIAYSFELLPPQFIYCPINVESPV